MPSLILFSDCLDSLIKILVDFNLPFVRVTPAGMLVKLSYVKMTRKVTNISIIEKGRDKVTITLPSKDLNKKKNKKK